MQMLNNIFTGTENLFKLLFINGILIILIGLFYPLQKRDELELKIIEYNSNVNLLNRDISELYNQSVELKNKIKEVRSKKTKIQDFQPQIKELHKKIYEQDKKKIEVENQKSLVDKLINQQETYDKYCKAFLVFGALITIIGLSGWSRLTYFLYDKEYSEYLQRRNSQLQNRPIRTRIILSILLLIILVASLYYILN